MQNLRKFFWYHNLGGLMRIGIHIPEYVHHAVISIGSQLKPHTSEVRSLKGGRRAGLFFWGQQNIHPKVLQPQWLFLSSI